MFKRKSREVPTLNTTSTADISFMLLIFFLVVSSMYIDKGHASMLPPADQHKDKAELLMQKDNVLQLKITENDRLLIDDKAVSLANVQPQIVSFIERLGDSHIITLEIAPQSTYNVYFELQDCILASYKQVRNKIALKKYGKGYSALNSEQRDSIRTMCPQRVFETYDTQNVGGQGNED